MVFPIVGGTQSTGYDIDNSLRFNDDDSANLSRSISSSGSNTNASISFWLKRGTAFGSQQILFTNVKTDYYFRVNLNSSSRLEIIDVTNGSVSGKRVTNRLFRDPSAWYHIFIGIDGGQGTEENRVKLYINGVAETSWNSQTAWQSTFQMNADDLTHYVGQRGDSAQYFDGYMSEFNYVDGTTKAHTDFGEFNDNGVWIPKAYSGSYGTNGFFLEFQQTGTSQNSSGIGADTSGNDNHFAVTNLAATDVTTDTPTNNFATLNPLSSNNATLSEGNVEGIRTSDTFTAVSTIAPSNGKWYFEYENTVAQNSQVGVVNLDIWPSGTNLYNFPANESCTVAIEANANYNITFAQDASNGSTLQNSVNLVTAKYGFAVDIDENNLYVSANGNWYTGSAFDDTDFSNATAVTTDLPSNVPLAPFANGSLANTFYINFGNPGGDDSISSGNADANGYGNFEYAVPSGFYALCTKNLAEFG